jgi:4-hydroxythreonine-4-phosphate dehydrogenase
MNAPKLVIVADDLTGAADSAARCVQAGLSAEIWLEASPQATDVDVVSISTDSRFLLPEEASQRVAATLSALASWAGATWYKKIDSTLRGNLGAELDAMLAALQGSVVVISPAFPAQGRGLEGGKLVYAGAPPRDLPALLAEQSRSLVGAIGLATVRQGVAVLQAALHERRAQGDRLLVVDALTERDLETIVAASQGEHIFLCGSAGMVAPLARRWAEKVGERTVSARVEVGPILALVGSGSAMAHAQVAQVAAAETMRVRALDDHWYEVDVIGTEGHPVGDWLIHLAPPDTDVLLEGATARAQAARLADVAFVAVEKLQPSAIFVVGGDTAYYALRRLGIERLTVAEELLPGIALAFGVDRTGQRRAVVLKPGNFGDAATLVTLQRAVRERQR